MVACRCYMTDAVLNRLICSFTTMLYIGHFALHSTGCIPLTRTPQQSRYHLQVSMLSTVSVASRHDISVMHILARVDCQHLTIGCYCMYANLLLVLVYMLSICNWISLQSTLGRTDCTESRFACVQETTILNAL